ncbi:CHY zinc finger domain-containing protein [Toxoplasma gondii GAB2-2007-GAL-DOM2]|nr:CHY zinc finger domain-containing protein [Toxoplasma gondii]KFG48265.1 CHY zinc finger domain-containing protein [Toxoplasma gondii GAB2-2007-GAL-DOM2]RQX74806.1 CHY zinc finger domain-containing protein [Toxoplasma gondii CAST]
MAVNTAGDPESRDSCVERSDAREMREAETENAAEGEDTEARRLPTPAHAPATNERRSTSRVGSERPAAGSPEERDGENGAGEEREEEGEEEDEEEDWEDVEEGESDDHLSFQEPRERTPEEQKEEDSGPWVGCPHYRRKCKVVAPCCDEVFWCRHCHNEVKSDGERDYRKAHELDRTAVSEIVCALCETKQPVSNKCIQCDTTFASYFCDICKFWDDEGLKKEVYHCDDCGLCRTGGRENYFHCQVCGSCYSTQIRNSHKCVEKAMHQPCPICCENMFTSVRQVHVLNCGHTLHADCLQQLNSECLGLQALRCPLCCKSLGDYARIWERLDEEVARTPLPEELRRKATAICNDCGTRSEVDYHIVGLKCRNCGGYNTREMNA